jgi:uncharacterized protein (DUF3084 family)
MAKTTGRGEDFLGLLAFGSLVANVAQAENRRKIQTTYDHLVMRYRQLEAEIGALRSYNIHLQKQVMELRGENNRLSAELAGKPAEARS